MLLNAEDFFKRTSFVSQSDESDLENGQTKTAVARVNATGYWDELETEEFIAVSLMLASSAPDLKELVKPHDGEAVIDTDDLRNSDIPSLMVSNNRQQDVVIVSEEQFADISPGDTVKVEFSLNTDEQGNRHLNGRRIERIQPEEVDYERVEFTPEEVGAVEAPEA